MVLTKCKKCGKEDCDLYEGLCYYCSLLEQTPLIDTNPIPDKLFFVAKVAKFGRNRRIVEIPKNQRPLINEDQEYLIFLIPRGSVEVDK